MDGDGINSDITNVPQGEPTGEPIPAGEPPTGEPPTGEPPTGEPTGDPPSTGVPNEDETWYESEGKKGEGTKPEWFKDDKYKTVYDQAKAYKDLETQFGAFTGKPKDGIYDHEAVSAELKEQGFEVDPEDPLFMEFVEYAKDKNMNQESFDDGVKMWAKSEMANEADKAIFKEEQIKALGENSDKIIQNMTDWCNANLPEEHREGFMESFPTTASLLAGQALIAMTQNAPLNPDEYVVSNGVTEKEVNDMLFALDDNGNRLVNTDKAHRARYEKANKELHGDRDDITYVG